MAYRITDSCVACGTCAGECPAEAISEGDIYSIDPDKCLDCGTCAGVCPTGAIEEAWLKSITLQAVLDGQLFFYDYIFTIIYNTNTINYLFCAL